MEQITAIKLAEELYKIHHHIDEINYVVYKEEDVIVLLQKLGFPEPDFDGYGKQCERELLSCPGDTIEETMEMTGITIEVLAKSMHVTTDTVKSLIQGVRKIDEDMANRLEKALKVPAHFWLEREKLYREKLEGLK